MPYAKTFVLPRSFDLRLTHTDGGDGLPHGIEDFQFIAAFLFGAAFVMLDDGGEVPRHKPWAGMSWARMTWL